ncbi:MAG: D-alanyl-D-alanine carboxypeptidase [Bacteroidota bacterium]
MYQHALRIISTLLFCVYSCLLTAQSAQIQGIDTIFQKSKLFDQIFTGFALYEPQQDSFLYRRAADKYYTPASNTKIFTLYTSLAILGDSIPALYYQETDSSFVFWGSGSPALLYSRLPEDESVLDFLGQQTKPLYFSTHNWKEDHFGPNWAWDDYNYAYQCERTPFPIYGNHVTFSHEKNALSFTATPSYFQNSVSIDEDLPNRYPRFVRDLDDNKFQCNYAALTGNKYERFVPFRYSDELFVQLLSDTLKREIKIYEEIIQIADIKAFYTAMPSDSIYQLLMQESDNFIAEQLLLTASNHLFGIQNSKQIIDFMKRTSLQDLADEPQWVDGSGLSRFNLFTPRSVVQVLDEIYKLLPEERLFNIFPAGGVSGTIEDWYEAEQGEQPYVFAKTGTLSNKHCLSGYLRTKSGKTLIFSFMNNNYIGSSSPVKREMQGILEYIRDSY